MIVVYANSYLSPMMFPFPLSLSCVNPFASQPFWSSFLDTLLQFSFQLLCREKEKKKKLAIRTLRTSNPSAAK